MRKIYHTPEEKREAQRAYNRKRQQTEHRRAYDRQRRNKDEARTQRRERMAVKRKAHLLAKQRRLPTPDEVEQATLFKVCPHCIPPTEKFLSEFAPNDKRKDGRAGWCRECARNWANSEEEKARQRAIRKEERRDPIRGQARRDRLNTWRREHPESQQELTMRRNARKKEATTERVSYKRILARDGYYCYICNQNINPNAKKRSPDSLTYDHIIPIQARPGEPQGTHCESNIKPSHKVCNARKSNKPFEILTSLDCSGP